MMSGPSRRQALLGVLLVASVAFLLYSLRSSRPRVTGGGDPAAQVASGAGEQEIAAVPSSIPDDVDFSRYRQLSQTNIFSARRSAPPEEPKGKSKPLPTPPPIKPPKSAGNRTKQPDFTGWTYTGYIAIGGEKRGILQNESSDSYRDVPVGGKFLGATVEEVTGEGIRLRSGSSVTTLSTPDLFPVVPLDNRASPAKPARPTRR
ncbi:MAG: hypothetical protein JSV79_05740 [Armatimonadota bacterium]|nr:MAG: hypothetical protein JSV79_05740 [Armatimonadota bacterium]